MAQHCAWPAFYDNTTSLYLPMSFLLTILGIALVLFLAFLLLAFGLVRQVLRLFLGQGGAQQRTRQYTQQRSQQRTAHAHTNSRQTKPTSARRGTIGQHEGTYIDYEEIN